MTYKNLLIRQRAYLADNKDDYDAQTKVAQMWFDKALATIKIKADRKAKKTPGGIVSESPTPRSSFYFEFAFHPGSRAARPCSPVAFWAALKGCCYNRIRRDPGIRKSPERPAPASTALRRSYRALYRELEAKVREYRPKDDLSGIERAFRFARQWHEGQMRDSGEPYMAHPAMVALDPGRHAHGHGGHPDGPPARRGRGYQRHRRAGAQGVRRRGRALRRRRDQAEQARFLLGRGAPGGELPQDAAGHGGGYPRHPGQACRPPPQHAHAGLSRPRPA